MFVVHASCSYKGNNYKGWQKQPSVPSVQETIEDVISHIFNQPMKIYASGRTDAGVHALNQHFHFYIDEEKDLDQLKYSINCLLPDDIRINNLKYEPEGFHARHNAISKIYRYDIRFESKDPFAYEFAYLLPAKEFDIDLLKKAANLFIGKHCFKDFTSKVEDYLGFIREIYSIDIVNDENSLSLTFKGSGFMRYQIRFLVGVLIEVATGSIDISFISDHLEDDKEREIISYKAPSNGLFLVDVLY